MEINGWPMDSIEGSDIHGGLLEHSEKFLRVLIGEMDKDKEPPQYAQSVST